VSCVVVVEIAEVPEVAAGDGQVEPDGQRSDGNNKLGEEHGLFWRSMLRGYKGARRLFDRNGR
jgi:hypothetical protein